MKSNRQRAEFRLCPDLEPGEEERPLFQQHITADTCVKRQDRGYFKCHKCAYHERARAWSKVEKVEVSAAPF